jgi:hypothetical protein
MNTYNGWTNYETWRVNLEMFDGMELGDFWTDTEIEAYELGEMLRDYAEQFLNEQASGLALDYALAFLGEVDWAEIAEHLLEDAKEPA